MQKIYWCLQQLHKIAGTEMVTLQIINMISDRYEIHIVPFSKEDRASIPYKINDNVIIEDIDFPAEVSQCEVNCNRYKQNGQYLKAVRLFFQTGNTYIFNNWKTRNKLENLSKDKDDIFIFASQELLRFAPRNRLVVSHFHYNSTVYNSRFHKVLRNTSRKPDVYIFLTDATKDAVDPKKKLASFTIPNPSRYKPILNTEYHNNSLISVCRLEDQKDPMLMVKIAKELEDRKFDFTYRIYGDGSYKKQMLDYVEENKLKNVEIISGVFDLSNPLSSSDLCIVTSKFEGFPLAAIEASSFSVPVVWMQMGDPTSTIVLEGKNGTVVEERDPKAFADAIIKLLSDKDELKSLKKTTYESSFRFDEEEIKKKWISTLDTLSEMAKNKN